MSRGAKTLALAAAILIATAGAALAYWTVVALYAPTNYALSNADTLPVGATPTSVTAVKTATNASTVTVQFTKQSTSASSNSQAITSYVIRRLNTSDVAQADTNCTAAAGATVSCPETLVPDGTWRYKVLAVRNSWTGQPGASSSDITLDTTPPAIATAIGQATGASIDGFLKQNTGFFIYANVTDATGVASVTASVTNITTGATSVPLVAGSFTSPGGASYNYRSAQVTANSSLSQGAKAYTVNATDNSSNSNTSTNTNNGSVTIDNTGPTAGTPTLASSFYNTTSVLVTMPSMTDSSAGVDSGSIQLQRQTATLSSSGGINTGTCGSFGSFATVATNPGATYSDTVPTSTCAVYRVLVSDNVSNSSTSSSSSQARVDTSAPSSPSITLSGGNASTFVAGGVVYINAQAGKSGSFSASATSLDNESGIQKINFPSLTGFSSGGGDDTASPFTSGTYNWSGAVGASGPQNVTSTNNSGLTATSAFTVVPDTTGPSVGTPTLASIYYTTTSLPVTLGAISDADSGVASSTIVLQRSVATLSSGGTADGTCGSFGAFSTVATNPASPFNDTVVSGNCYRYQLVASDNVGNQTTSSVSSIGKVDTSAPTTPTLSLSGATGNTFVSGTTAYINAQAGASGAFSASATTTDGQSGIQKVNFPSLTGFSSGGGDDTTSPYSSGTYTWSGAVGANGAQTVTATNNAGLTSSSTFTVTSDTTGPVAPTPSVGQAFSSGTTVVVSFSNVTDAGSGVSSYVLQRSAGTLSSSDGIVPGTCNGFGSFAQVGGANPASPFSDTGLATPACYQYRIVATDNVGNSTTSTISTTAALDGTAPSAPSLTLSGATGSTFVTGTTAYINAQASRSGGFAVGATTTDSQSGILKVNFPSPAGFSAGGGDDSASPFSTSYAWANAVSASGSQTVTATNNSNLTATSTFSVVKDTTAPTGGAFTVNGTAATSGGSTSTSTSSSFTITGRTDFTEAQSATASGLASSVLTIQSTSLTGTTCGAAGSGGAYTAPTTISGTSNPATALGFCYIYVLTGTDNVGNVSTVSSTVKVPISVTALAITNSSGTAGRPDQGDVITLTFNGAIPLSSVCSSWSNASQTVTAITVTMSKGNGSNTNDLSFSSGTVGATSCGGFAIGAMTTTSQALNTDNNDKNFTGSTATYNSGTNQLVITLGSCGGSCPTGAVVNSSTYTYAAPATIAVGTVNTGAVKNF